MSNSRYDFWNYIEDPGNSLEEKIKFILNNRNCSSETLSTILGVSKVRVAMEMKRLQKWKEVKIVSKRNSRIWGLS